MGLFDKVFGSKNNDDQKKDTLRVNANETEDIGIVTHYNDQPFTGVLYELDGEGRLLTEMQMKNGLKDGLYTDYYANGKVMSELKYTKDEFLQYLSFYDIDGVDHLENSHCILKENLVRNESEDIYVLDGSPYTGFAFEFAFGGFIFPEFKSGKMIREKMFWENGVLRSENDYQQGFNMELRIQMEDGRLLRETKDGCRYTYHEDGYIEEELNIKNQDKKRFYDNGEIKSISSDFRRETATYDTEKSFFKNGKISSLTHHHKGIRITETYHVKNSNIYKIEAYNA